MILCDKDALSPSSVDAGGLYVEWGNAQEGYYIDIYKDASKSLTNAFAPGSYTVKLNYQVSDNAAMGEHILKFECVDICNENHRNLEFPRLEDGKITVPANIRLDKTALYLTVKDETAQLTATTNPDGLSVTWTSSDDKVATVSDAGLVTAVGDGVATITAAAGDVKAECSVLVNTDASRKPVFFFPEQEEVKLAVSDYTDPIEATPYGNGFVVLLKPGAYTYTATKSGCYGSTCGFKVNADGTVDFRQNWTAAIKTQYGLDKLLDSDNATFYLDLEVFTKSTNPGAWDGVTLDVSWFDPNNKTHRISTPAQFAGLAAIVNGIYNNEIETIIDYNPSGTLTGYTPEEYDAYPGAKIKAGCTGGNSTGGNNLISTSDYYFSALGYDFDGHTVYLTADLDMGGYQDADGNWTGACYMPIGGQYVMHYVKNELSDGYSRLGSSFNGKLEGNGHLVYNIYCDRYSDGANFGDSQSIGLIGRLGNHDSDYSTWKSLQNEGKNGNYGGNYPAVNPSVRNVAVAGYVYGRRSVGGIVGKIGQTSASNLSDGSLGGLIENCVNFATVHNTDTKGVGGIVGASWNKGAVRSCVNFGHIYTTFRCPTGGIVGSNEVPVSSCYNMGQITAKQDRYAMAIGTSNGGGNDIRNCYWLTGTAAGGGYYGSVVDKTQIKEITDNYSGTALKAAEFMQSDSFVSLLNGTTSRTFKQAGPSDPIYKLLSAAGYPGAPVPRVFTADTATIIEIKSVSNPTKLTYIEGERFDTTGLEIRVLWSDGTDEVLNNYTCSIDRPLALGDREIIVSVTAGSITKPFPFSINVIPVSLEKITVKNQPTCRAYNEGDCFDPAGMTVEITYTNGTTATAVWQDGKFVDSADNTKVYDTMTLSIPTDEPLTTAHSDKAVTVTYTFTDGVKKTADTSKLTVVSAAGKPKQEDGVYLVGTAAELDWIAAQVNNGLETDPKARLTADITASKDFEPIGNSSNEFTGTFDGDHHRVTLSLERNKQYTGLFGYISNATVKNTIADGTVNSGTSGSYLAGVVGYAVGSSLIENCGNEANITSGGNYIGGVVGRIDDTTIVRGCYNRGSVTATTDKKTVGGVIGCVDDYTCRVKNCYNLGDVTGGAASGYGVGGVIGYVQGGISEAIAANLYNAGKVTNRDSNYAGNTGAIFGYGYSTHAANYYWLEKSADCAFGQDTNVETGKLTAEKLKAAAEKLGEAFKDSKHGYPLLTWQTDAHSWGEWTQTKAPTCSTKGEESRTCSAGGETETREVAQLTHTDGDHDSRCDLCGAAMKAASPTTGDTILVYAVLSLTASAALLALLSKKKRVI